MPRIGTCILCGGQFETVSNRRTYRSKICQGSAECRDPPEIAEALEALSIAFVAAVRIDPEYVVEIVAEGSRQAARQAA